MSNNPRIPFCLNQSNWDITNYTYGNHSQFYLSQAYSGIASYSLLLPVVVTMMIYYTVKLQQFGLIPKILLVMSTAIGAKIYSSALLLNLCT